MADGVAQAKKMASLGMVGMGVAALRAAQSGQSQEETILEAMGKMTEEEQVRILGGIQSASAERYACVTAMGIYDPTKDEIKPGIYLKVPGALTQPLQPIRLVPDGEEIPESPEVATFYATEILCPSEIRHLAQALSDPDVGRRL